MSSKFEQLPLPRQEAILLEAKTIGAYKASEKYAKEVGSTVNNLYNKLKSMVDVGKTEKESEKSGGFQKKFKLSKRDKELLNRFEKGEVTLEEANKIVAIRAFERILTGETKVSITNWIQSELLKIKKAEVENKNNWAMEIMNRMWLGQLPPQACPKCGHNWYNDHPLSQVEVHRGDGNRIEEGEVLDA